MLTQRTMVKESNIVVFILEVIRLMHQKLKNINFNLKFSLLTP